MREGIIYVEVPTNITQDEAFEIVKQYEKLFGVEEIALDPFPGFLPTDPGV